MAGWTATGCFLADMRTGERSLVTGRTHMAVGAAVAVAAGLVAARLADPAAASASLASMGDASLSPAAFLSLAAAGAAGGMLPDTDVATSEASRELRRAWAALVALLALALALAAAGALPAGQDPLAWLREHAGRLGPDQLAGCMTLVAVCAAGRASGHRGFSHSLVALVAAYAATRLALPSLSVPLALGYASHLALDLLNKTPLRLLWPLRRGVCLGLLRSAGMADGLVLGLALLALLCSFARGVLGIALPWPPGLPTWS
ncbi:putative membrane-bound metal-dependent hydrolase [Olsenella sp. DNF00959]|nr:putative membrane-bound metal-dependent hydrolase [Olsenella sp. DNF00959]